MRVIEKYYHIISAISGITDLPNGVAPSDAVNVSQLDAVAATIPGALTFGNGLTENLGDVRLGGTYSGGIFVGPTGSTGATLLMNPGSFTTQYDSGPHKSWTFAGFQQASLNYFNNDTGLGKSINVSASNNGLFVRDDIHEQGLRDNGDYSANKGPLHYITKQMLDSALAGVNLNLDQVLTNGNVSDLPIFLADFFSSDTDFQGLKLSANSGNSYLENGYIGNIVNSIRMQPNNGTMIDFYTFSGSNQDGQARLALRATNSSPLREGYATFLKDGYFDNAGGVNIPEAPMRVKGADPIDNDDFVTKGFLTSNLIIPEFTQWFDNAGAKTETHGYATYNGQLKNIIIKHGAGSTLDADLLDGLQGSAYAKLSGGNNWTGPQTITDDWSWSVVFGGFTSSISASGGISTSDASSNVGRIQSSGILLRDGANANSITIARPSGGILSASKTQRLQDASGDIALTADFGIGKIIGANTTGNAATATTATNAILWGSGQADLGTGVATGTPVFMMAFESESGNWKPFNTTKIKTLLATSLQNVTDVNALTTNTITIRKDNIGTTVTDSLLINNETAAANGAQQYSPALHFRGYAWANVAAASRVHDWRTYVLTSQSNSGASVLSFDLSSNGGAYVSKVQIAQSGLFIYNPAGTFRSLLIASSATDIQLTLPAITGTLALISDLVPYALDANVVHKTGGLTESVDGPKTFTDIFNTGNPGNVGPSIIQSSTTNMLFYKLNSNSSSSVSAQNTGAVLSSSIAGSLNAVRVLATGVIDITDSVNSKGAVYANDYSANFTARSLVDRGYVDNNFVETTDFQGLATAFTNALNVVDSARTIPHTKTTLNTDYPSAPIRFKVICTDPGVSTTYEKYDATNWFATNVTILP